MSKKIFFFVIILFIQFPSFGGVAAKPAGWFINENANRLNFMLEKTEVGCLYANEAKPELFIYANSTARVYGAANPQFTARYDGFIDGEDETALSGGLSFDCAAGISSPAGSYIDIIPKGLTSGKYDIIFVRGVLYIEKAYACGSVYIQGWKEGNNPGNPELLDIPSALTSAVTPVYMYKEANAPDSAYKAEKPLVAGDYVLRAAFAESSNYYEFVTHCNFSIEKKSSSAGLIICIILAAAIIIAGIVLFLLRKKIFK